MTDNTVCAGCRKRVDQCVCRYKGTHAPPRQHRGPKRSNLMARARDGAPFPVDADVTDDVDRVVLAIKLPQGAAFVTVRMDADEADELAARLAVRAAAVRR